LLLYYYFYIFFNDKVKKTKRIKKTKNKMFLFALNLVHD